MTHLIVSLIILATTFVIVAAKHWSECYSSGVVDCHIPMYLDVAVILDTSRPTKDSTGREDKTTILSNKVYALLVQLFSRNYSDIVPGLTSHKLSLHVSHEEVDRRAKSSLCNEMKGDILQNWIDLMHTEHYDEKCAAHRGFQSALADIRACGQRHVRKKFVFIVVGCTVESLTELAAIVDKELTNEEKAKSDFMVFAFSGSSQKSISLGRLDILWLERDRLLNEVAKRLKKDTWEEISATASYFNYDLAKKLWDCICEYKAPCRYYIKVSNSYCYFVNKSEPLLEEDCVRDLEEARIIKYGARCPEGTPFREQCVDWQPCIDDCETKMLWTQWSNCGENMNGTRRRHRVRQKGTKSEFTASCKQFEEKSCSPMTFIPKTIPSTTRYTHTTAGSTRKITTSITTTTTTTTTITTIKPTPTTVASSTLDKTIVVIGAKEKPWYTETTFIACIIIGSGVFLAVLGLSVVFCCVKSGRAKRTVMIIRQVNSRSIKRGSKSFKASTSKRRKSIRIRPALKTFIAKKSKQRTGAKRTVAKSQPLTSRSSSAASADLAKPNDAYLLLDSHKEPAKK